MPTDDESTTAAADARGAGGGRVVAAIAWLVGFALVAAAGRALTPWPEDFAVTPKLAWLREHPDAVDTLFIGKSHVFRSFVPPVVDEVLEKRGRPTRSFNMGAEGMSDCEIDHVLRTVLELDGLQLDTVWIETPDWVWRSAVDENMDTNRSVNWHTPRQVARMLRRLVYLDEPWRDRVELAWMHLRNGWLRATSYGQGRRIVRSLLGHREPQPLTQEEIDRERGFQAAEEVDTTEARIRRERFAENAEEGLPQRVRHLVKRNRIVDDLSHYDFGALEAQLDVVRAAGAEPRYFVPPAMHPTQWVAPLAEGGHLPNDPPVFNDPQRHPQLFTLETRWDSHLNRRGAEVFSRIFANTMARDDD